MGSGALSLGWDGRTPTVEATGDAKRYGPGKHEMCKDCLVHSGFETTVAFKGTPTLGDAVEMVRWSLS